MLSGTCIYVISSLIFMCEHRQYKSQIMNILAKMLFWHILKEALSECLIQKFERDLPNHLGEMVPFPDSPRLVLA